MPNIGLDRNRNSIVRLENSIVQSQDMPLMVLYSVRTGEEISDGLGVKQLRVRIEG